MKFSSDHEPWPLEPDASCDRCGTLGTVARYTTYGTLPLVLRFCRTCWREVRGQYLIPHMFDRPVDAGAIAVLQRRVAPGAAAPTSISSAAWEDVIDYIRLLTLPRRVAFQFKESDLGSFAVEIVDKAPRMDGPMPDEVLAFVRAHTPSSS